MRWMGTCLVVLGGLLAGCQSLPSRDVQQLESFQTAKGNAAQIPAYPMPLRVAVAPTLQAYESGFLPPDDASELPGTFPSDVIDPENVYKVPISETETDLQGEVIKALDALELFASVSEFPGAFQRQGVKLVPEADADEYNYLVVPRVRHNFVSYKGANDAWWWPGLFGWIFAWIPTYFVPDETFEAYLDIELEVYNVRLANTIISEHPELLGAGFEAELAAALEPAKVFGQNAYATQEADISDLDMGFVTTVPWSAVTVRFFGRSWGVLEAGNFVNVSEVVTPPALAKNLGDICKVLVENFSDEVKDREDDLQQAAKRRYAVIVGVGSYSDSAFKDYSVDAEGAQISFAAEDARSMYRFLKSSCGFREADMALLINNGNGGDELAATRANILAQIERRRTGPREDLLIIYFAGHSAVDAEIASLLEEDGSLKAGDGYTKYLLPYDARADNLAGTGLPISKDAGGLVDVLNKVDSEKVVLIFDTPFGRHSFMRSELFELLDANDDGMLGQGEEPTIRPSFLADIYEQKARDILLAADFNEPVMQNTITSQGEFCYQFTKVAPRLIGPRLNLQELAEFVQGKIFRLSRFRNQPQQPRIFRGERLPEINLKPSDN